ncbi:glycosyltransferase family 4 protein [Skermanella pratensis]|uniref:glycosyltransferase family 4 protein n=1 Tax=Skermanella pratensis TaxID=2233999 RepID=UPI001301395D
MPDGRKQNLLLWYWGRRGGGAHYCLEVARELSRRDEFNLHLSISRNCDLYREMKELGLPGLDVDTYCDVGSAVMALSRVPGIRRRFQDYLEKHEIDLVLCTMQHLWNPFMLPVIRRVGARYVVTIHDAALHPGERFLPYQWWLDWEIRQADGYVVLSDHVGSVLRTRHGTAIDRIAVAPCGPFNQFTDAGRICRPAGEARAPRRLLFFGRIIAYKGLDLLLDAYGRLKTTYPDLSLAIYGDGDLSPYRAALEGLADVTVENRYIAEEELPAILEEADLIILPYREASQSGVLVLAEAAGLPVVGTPTGALVEQIVPGVNGLIATGISGEALAVSIGRLLDDPALYHRCVQSISRNAEDRWSEAGDRISRFLLGSIPSAQPAPRYSAAPGPAPESRLPLRRQVR